MSKTQAFEPSDSWANQLERALVVLQYHKVLRTFGFAITEMSNDNLSEIESSDHKLKTLEDQLKLLRDGVFGVSSQNPY